MTKRILALDLASRSGFAFGEPGAGPVVFGSHRFASPGASHQAIFGKAIDWTTEKISELKPDMVIFEEPLFFRGRKSRAGNNEILYGLPAIISGVCFNFNVFDVRQARVDDIRMHFIGCKPKREEAKRRVMQRCRQIGWDVPDDNAGDACALWDYACAQLKVEKYRQLSLLSAR